MNKKIKIIIICGVIIVVGVITFIIVNKKVSDNEKVVNEYQPEEEISEEQERETILSLYYRNKTSKEIEPEAKLIDVKKLMNDTYTTIMQLLIDNPNNDNLESTIPSGTSINGISRENDVLTIDFSKEFIDNHEGGKDSEMQTINSIVNTFTELTEIDAIKIKINGEEGKEFLDGEVNFKENFVRED